MAMKLVKKTDEYSIFKRSDDRYAVVDANKNAVNGEEKVKILLTEELIKITAPAAPEEAAVEEEAAAEEAPAEEEEAAKEEESAGSSTARSRPCAGFCVHGRMILAIIQRVGTATPHETHRLFLPAPRGVDRPVPAARAQR